MKIFALFFLKKKFDEKKMTRKAPKRDFKEKLSSDSTPHQQKNSLKLQKHYSLDIKNFLLFPQNHERSKLSQKSREIWNFSIDKLIFKLGKNALSTLHQKSPQVMLQSSPPSKILDPHHPTIIFQH